MQVEQKPLDQVPAEELCKVLEDALRRNFKEASVRLTTCPDLSAEPFHLAAPGLGGRPVLLDVGGTNNLYYPENRKLNFNLKQIAAAVGRPDAALLGPGAGHCCVIPEGVNSEFMCTASLKDSVNRSKYSIVDPKDKSCVLKDHPSYDFGLMANLLCSDGTPATQVLEIRAKYRTGTLNFVTCMRQALLDAYPQKALALGGSFRVVSGRVRAHIMPDFAPGVMLEDWIQKEWLVFYQMRAPLTCVSVFVTQDLGLELRKEHTHFFSQHGEGGHYHNDITPEEVEYHGFYVPCEQVYRIQRATIPPQHQNKS